jgi:tetratricopeptide (TPR) repeat protein
MIDIRGRAAFRIAILAAMALATVAATAKSPSHPAMDMPMSDDRMAQIMGSEHMMSVPAGSPESIALSQYAANDPLPPPDTFNVVSLTRDITAKNATVRKWFNQGLRYFYAFNHRESYRAFRYALQLDPQCVMCAWGEAMSLGVNINQLDQPEADRVLALQLLTTAAKIPDSSRPAETALVKALMNRYQLDGGEQDVRNRAYADAMLLQVYRRYPGDPDVETATADAVMNTNPWRYWNTDGTEAFAGVRTAREAIEHGLSKYPKHMGLVHWYVHLMEGSRTPEKAEPYARILTQLAPEAGHLIHMPSHIYYRVGDQLASVEANRNAVLMDRTYFDATKLSHPEGDRYRWGYYRHNIHFMLSSAILTGRRDDIKTAAEWLLGSEDPKILFRTDRYRGIYYQAVVYYMTFAEIMALKAPPDTDAWRFAQASYDYAQALAYIRSGSGSAVDHYQKLLAIAAGDFKRVNKDDYDNQKAIEIMAQVVEARKRERFKLSDPMAPINEAVSTRNKMDYDEPPFWMVSPLQTRAAMEIASGALDAAIRDIHESFGRDAPGGGNPTLSYRGNAWGYYALMEAYRRKPTLTPAERTDFDSAKREFGRLCPSGTTCAVSLDTM